jgi:hypothetical protein
VGKAGDLKKRKRLGRLNDIFPTQLCLYKKTHKSYFRQSQRVKSIFLKGVSASCQVYPDFLVGPFVSRLGSYLEANAFLRSAAFDTAKEQINKNSTQKTNAFSRIRTAFAGVFKNTKSAENPVSMDFRHFFVQRMRPGL